MNAIDTALRRIMTIPKEVLKQAFMPVRYDPTRQARYYDNTTPLSLEAIIRDQLIYGRVMPDINLISGTEDFIPLSLGKQQWIDPFNSIYRFGDEATGGRTMTSVFEVTYSYASNSMVGGYGGYGSYDNRSSALLKSARDVLRTSVGVSPRSTAYVQLVGHNTVMINDVTPIQNAGALRCKVTHDPNLNNLVPAYHQRFATLALLATKAYVYTALVVDLDEGMLRGGQQIGRFREIVDSYADSDTMYMEELTRFTKVGIMNDPNEYRKVLRMAIGIRPKLG